mgnify:CR=1 FL=1
MDEHNTLKQCLKGFSAATKTNFTTPGQFFMQEKDFSKMTIFTARIQAMDACVDNCITVKSDAVQMMSSLIDLFSVCSLLEAEVIKFKKLAEWIFKQCLEIIATKTGPSFGQ